MHQISLETARETERMNQFAVYNHIEMVEVEPDHAIFRLNIRPESKNGYAMADNATGFAAHTDGRSYVTQTSALHFLRNQSEGEIRADAQVRHRGHSTCLVAVDILGENNKLIATGEAQVKDDLIASVDTGAGTMGIGWPGWYTPTADSTADYIALSGAVSKGGETHNANVYGIWTIGIPANSQNQELAAELLTYLMDKDVQKSTVDKGGVPCRYSSLQDPEILKTYPQYEVVCKALEGGVYRPVIAEWTQFYTILGTEMDNIINGVKTVDQGLADAQSQLETLMAG